MMRSENKERELTADLARQMFDVPGGTLTWKTGIRKGKSAGWVENNGYVRVQVGRFVYLAHRVVWLIERGVWPTGDVDHINGNKTDNSITNLRDVSKNLNLQNQTKPHRSNKLGVLGVVQRGKKFRAQIRVDGKNIRLGTFNNHVDAFEAYKAAKRQMHEGNML